MNFGNTSAASIPLTMDLGIREGKLNNGERIMIYGFGAGLTHAGLLLNWNLHPQLRLPESEL
ncbi:3-oxoacyl-[acyl-carrier-protein] synthase 3 protein 2 [compost metagenome]